MQRITFTKGSVSRLTMASILLLCCIGYAAGQTELSGPKAEVRGTNESDNFWVVYLQTGYQGDLTRDIDPATESANGGVTTTPSATLVINDRQTIFVQEIRFFPF